MGIESPVHLLFIAIVALIVLGPKRLPELARALGKGVREFRGAMEEGQSEAEDADADELDEHDAEAAAGDAVPAAQLAPGAAARADEERGPGRLH